MNIHLTLHLSRGICILPQLGLAAPEKRSPCSCNSHFQTFFYFFMALYFSSAPRSSGIFHLDLNLLSNIFQSSASVGQHKYFLNSSRIAQQPWGRIYRWYFGQPDIARRCRSLLFPGVSALLQVSIEPLRAC